MKENHKEGKSIFLCSCYCSVLLPIATNLGKDSVRLFYLSLFSFMLLLFFSIIITIASNIITIILLLFQL